MQHARAHVVRDVGNVGTVQRQSGRTAGPLQHYSESVVYSHMYAASQSYSARASGVCSGRFLVYSGGVSQRPLSRRGLGGGSVRPRVAL